MARSEYSQGKKLKVISKVSHRWFGGQHVLWLIEMQVNPDIMGGLVVEIGDRTIDLSVSARIAKMNKLLTDAL